MLRRLRKNRPEVFFFVVIACAIAVGTFFAHFPAFFGPNPLFIPAPAERLIEPLSFLSDMAGEAAKEDGVYYFRTPDDALCSWDGETVETLLPPGEFTGQYLYMEHGVLFYSDRKGLGLFAYEPATGLSEQLIEYDRSLAVWYPTFWWTDADGYYLLTKTLSDDRYEVSYYDQNEELIEGHPLPASGWGEAEGWEDYPSALESVSAITGDSLICITDSGNVGLYNYTTGGWETLLEADGEPYGSPIGFQSGKLIFPQGESLYWSLDPETGEKTVFARLDDPALRLESVDGETVYAVRSDGPGDTLGLWRDGTFIPIGPAEGVDCQVGAVAFVSGEPDEVFANTAVIDLTGSPVSGGISQYAVLPDGTVYRLYASL